MCVALKDLQAKDFTMRKQTAASIRERGIFALA